MSRTTLRRMLSLLLALNTTVSLMGTTALAAEVEDEAIPEQTEPAPVEPAPEEELAQAVTFDLSQGGVTAGAEGVTGVLIGDTESTTVSWADVADRELVVTGTSAKETDVITMAAGCPQDLTLILDNVEIISDDPEDSPRTRAAISMQTAEARTLTLLLKGHNSLHTVRGRLLWTQSGSTMRFVGQDTEGQQATLELSDEEEIISLFYGGTTGMFDFENCAVTLAGRDLDAGKQALSKGTKLYLSQGASITDGTGETFYNGISGEVTYDISAGDVTISKQYTTPCGDGYLVYRDAKNLTHVISGVSANNRVTVTYPDAKVVLRDLSITTATRSAFLVKYEDPADCSQMLTVQIDGTVELRTDTASAFNTNESEKGAALAQVTVEGVTQDAVLNITRTADGDGQVNSAVGVDLTVKALECSINKNCMGDVTADAGSVVFLAGETQGTAVEREGGQLIRGVFDYFFLVDGRVFHPVPDPSRSNLPTLLLPGDADLSDVTMQGTPGWTVTYDETADSDGTVSLDFQSADDNTVTLTVTPPEQARPLGAVEQELTIRAMQAGADIPALYLTIAPDSEHTMAQVEADPNHDTRATGTAVLLGDSSLPEMEMEVKGRGNASWARAKKSFQVKLDKKTDVLGMGKAKKWVLLPSAADLSLIRNSVALDLAQQLELEFTSNWRYVDFYVEGKYYGLYLLCEKPEIGDNRIEITDLDQAIEDAIGSEDANGDDKLLSGEVGVTYNLDHSIATLSDGTTIDLTGGYHLEFDNYDDSLQFTAGAIQHVTVKEPERLGSAAETDDSFTYIRNFMAQADAAITDYEDDETLLQYIDLESFAKMWLLQEYTAGHDATDNLHLWKDSNVTGDGLIHAGPAWDFDNCMARDEDFAKVVQVARTQRITDGDADKQPETGKYANYNARWLAQLMRHTVFQEEVTRQYEKYRNLFTCCPACGCASAVRFEDLNQCRDCGSCYVHNTAADHWDFVQDSIAMDTVRWYGVNFVSASLKKPVQPFYREQAAHNIMLFACVRNGYLEERITQWGAKLYDVTFISNGEAVVTIPVGSTGLQTLPAFERSGYDFKGWFYLENGEEKPFTAGTPVTGDLTVNAKWTPKEDLTVTCGENVEKVYDGQTAVLTVTASHSAESASYTYQWYRIDPEHPESAAKLEGATSSSYSVIHTADSGTYFCRVTARVEDTSLVLDSQKMTVQISPKTLDADAVGAIANQTYTGSAVTPALTVMDGSTILIEGTDYTVAYADNISVGTASATVTFQGNYEGTVTRTFAIVKRAPGNSGGGNGNSGYQIKDATPNRACGSIKITPRRAAKGETVTITPKPHKGYELDTITAQDSAGNLLTITKQDGRYTFVMPASAVTVKAAFRASNMENPFKDVKPGDWYYDAVRCVYHRGQMRGITDNTFGPNKAVTRSMVVTILWNLEGCPTAAGRAPFHDVPADSYCAQAVRWAREAGIVQGYGSGIFGPDDCVKREQLAVMLFHYAVYKGYDVSQQETADLSPFKDVSRLSLYAEPAMRWCVGSRLMNGTENGILDPVGTATRAQTAKIICSFCEKIAESGI